MLDELSHFLGIMRKKHSHLSNLNLDMFILVLDFALCTLEFKDELNLK